MKKNSYPLDHFFYQSFNLMFIISSDRKLIKANPAFCNLLGIDEYQFTDKSLYDFIYDIDKPLVDESIQNFIETEDFETVVFRLVAKTGESLWVSWKSIFMHDNVFYCIAKNITKEKRIKSEAKDSRRKLLKIINMIPHPIFLKNKSFQYILVNQAQADLFSTTPEVLLGKDDHYFVKAADEIKSIQDSDIKILAERLQVDLPEQKITRIDGKKIILHTTKIPFVSDLDGEVSILGVSIDITEIKRYEGELLKINFELDSFVYKTSHDLKAPMCSIEGLLNLLRIEHDDSIKEIYIDKAQKSIRQLDKFISDLTDYSRNSRQEVKRTKIDFQALISNCIGELQFMENAERLNISIKIIGKEFYSDESRIKILVMNIISNAIKYQNTKVNFSYLNIIITVNEANVHLLFEDNGVGVEKQFQEKVFEMFYRASEESKGAGLGLYIVKQIIEKLDGHIEMKSEYCVGTKFTVTLANKVTEIKEKEFKMLL